MAYGATKAELPYRTLTMALGVTKVELPKTELH